MKLLDKHSNATATNISQTALKQNDTVYNFKVQDFSTYHIGELGVWVYNADCCVLQIGANAISYRTANALNKAYGINLKESYYNLAYAINMSKDRVPPGFIPIGSDPFGDLIVIGITGNELGKIYFWDNEFDSDNNKPVMLNMHLLATSFNEFLKTYMNSVRNKVQDYLEFISLIWMFR